jgi:hypothetical protein
MLFSKNQRIGSDVDTTTILRGAQKNLDLRTQGHICHIMNETYKEKRGPT